MPKVTLRCEEVIVYRKTFDISDEAFAEYTAAVDRDEDDQWFSDFATRYIDPSDVDCGTAFDDVELTLAPRTQ